MDIMAVVELTLVLSSAVFTGAFVLLYFTKSSWRSSTVGKAMLFQALSWLALLIIGISAVADGDSILWQPGTRIFVLGLLTASSGFLLYALVNSLNTDLKKDLDSQ